MMVNFACGEPPDRKRVYRARSDGVCIRWRNLGDRWRGSCNVGDARYKFSRAAARALRDAHAEGTP